jgi:SAM-dependent methyltransferase
MNPDLNIGAGQNFKSSVSGGAVRRRGLIYALARFDWIHRLIALSGAYQLANMFLKNYPIYRRRPLGSYYRLKSVSSFALAEEMMSFHGCYQRALLGYQVETFVDLGCNTGWFPILLKEANGGGTLAGVLIDADPAMVEETRWHLKKNGLTQCTVLCGVVGCPEDGREVTFYVNPANTQSSTKPITPEHPFPLKGKLQEVRVPSLRVAQEWMKRLKIKKSTC